jgi:hypothetical protein
MPVQAVQTFYLSRQLRTSTFHLPPLHPPSLLDNFAHKVRAIDRVTLLDGQLADLTCMWCAYNHFL